MSDKDTSEEKLIPLANDPKTAKQIECVLRLAAISLDVDWDNPKDWAEGRGNQVRELAIKIVEAANTLLQQEIDLTSLLMRQNKKRKTNGNGNGVN